MADILSIFDQLKEEQAKIKAAKAPRNPKDLASQNARKNAKQDRGRKLSTISLHSSSSLASPSIVKSPPPPSVHIIAAPRADVDVNFLRSPSPDPSARRISFVDSPRPSANRFWIATRGASLASGFEYDPRLNKYKVSEQEWRDFTKELLAAAGVSGPIWTWVFRKKKVRDNIRRDLQYFGDVSRCLKKWNKLFRRQRFQATLELPGHRSDDDAAAAAADKLNLKRFRIMIAPVLERGVPSVYSRNSSMTRSVTGEGVAAAMARTAGDG